MNGSGTTASYSIPAGEYYMYYAASGILSGLTTSTLTLFGQTIPTTLVTSGSTNAFKSTNKVTVNQNGNFTWKVELDD